MGQTRLIAVMHEMYSMPVSPAYSLTTTVSPAKLCIDGRKAKAPGDTATQNVLVELGACPGAAGARQGGTWGAMLTWGATGGWVGRPAADFAADPISVGADACVDARIRRTGALLAAKRHDAHHDHGGAGGIVAAVVEQGPALVPLAGILAGICRAQVRIGGQNVAVGRVARGKVHHVQINLTQIVRHLSTTRRFPKANNGDGFTNDRCLWVRVPLCHRSVACFRQHHKHYVIRGRGAKMT